MRRIDEDPDFVNLPRLGNSLRRAVDRYPDGATDRVIGMALGIPESEVQATWEQVVAKLRRAMGVVL